ncbi:calcium-binding protein CML42-like [Dendrobium catenatum]|uniref:Calcium-binding protein CML42 n=1 Tax=Dendrobium catenatum TaxID=906689 RepID=A0A2I0XC00_9ASPA|nr:calcium-binding protein CML42-like [Dendrobium catenatum]PKU85435.1 Calcium-binding protein CML42 [Dendrobium catenatum]
MAEAFLKSSPSLKPAALPRASPSFRLRSCSLNSVRLRRVFDIFDRNGDGVITADELCEALDRLGLGADPSDLRSLVASFLQPGQSGLNFDAFHSLHRELGDAIFGDNDGGEEEEEDDMMEAFRVFDEDGDGYISAKELQTVLGKLGLVEGRSIDRVYEMIGSVDRNRDGRVDYFEFKNMMKSVPVQIS